MENGPRILLWNYSFEERLEMDHLFQAVGAPLAQAIETEQGYLPVREILFADNKSEQAYSCNEKIMLFYNVPAQTIHNLMKEAKQWNLPKPIYAIVTPQSIDWKFADLVDHLIKERDFIQQRIDGEKKKHSCPHE